jgi:hypothetical protein
MQALNIIFSFFSFSDSKVRVSKNVFNDSVFIKDWDTKYSIVVLPTFFKPYFYKFNFNLKTLKL